MELVKNIETAVGAEALTATAIGRDLILNLKRLLTEGALTPEEGLFALLAVSRASNHGSLSRLAEAELQGLGVDGEKIREARESAAIMGMLNTYYRFRHMIGESENYRTAGLRMTALAKPVLGKELFEMLAFAVSVINGCENCVKSHEKVLREAGVTVDKVHDLARLASVVRGLSFLSL